MGLGAYDNFPGYNNSVLKTREGEDHGDKQARELVEYIEDQQEQQSPNKYK